MPMGRDGGSKGVAGFVLAFALLSSGSTAIAHPSAPPPVDKTLLPYASTKESARLPDGRMIHLVCIGRGSPVVVLTAGGSGWSMSWATVQAKVAAKTRVCSWDPAGLGLSSASGAPQTSDTMASDLQAALKARGIDGPYVMVGHSLGAYVSLLLADRRPSRVAGMVLVDPSLPDQAAIFARVTPAQTAWQTAHPNPQVIGLERCAAALRSGSVRRGGPDPDGCLRLPPWPPDWPPELLTALNRRWAEGSPASIAAALDTIASNMKSVDQDTRVVINPARNYGDMPLIVLTASRFRSPPDYSDAAKAEIPAFQAEWRRGHDAYAALSTRGINRVVPDSSHDMVDEKPEAVIEAIDAVVDQVRESRRARPAR
jgi:pimeloyl-ACP methyl ester carboxylesterase